MKMFIRGTAGILLNKTTVETSHVHSSKKKKTHLTHTFVAFFIFLKLVVLMNLSAIAFQSSACVFQGYLRSLFSYQL